MVRKRFVLILLVFLLQITKSGQLLAYASTYPNSIQNFGELGKEAYTKSKTQGMAVVTVEGQTDSFLNMGETNQSDVSEDTLFELGSISKSFTALAIYYMEGQGLIDLDADIQKYIPELSFDYSKVSKNSLDEEEQVTIWDLLCHTSGIPWISTVYLPEGQSENMLQETVLGESPIVLDTMPGEKYCYASINYDILGLLIQKISGMSYENYMEKVIFPMLGMNHTYVYDVPDEESKQLSPGYEYLFFQTKAWQTPAYRGNEPAGYIISCARDMKRWLEILLGQIEVTKDLKEAVEQEFSFAHSVEVTGGLQYSSGWFWDQKEERYFHGGSNPGFSSMISLNLKEGDGICILTNQNSNLSEYLAASYFDILSGRNPDSYHTGVMRICDIVCSCVLIIVSILLTMTLIKVSIMVADIVRKKRRFQWKMKNKSIVILVLLYGLTGFVFGGLMDSHIWRALYVWLPKTVTFSLQAGLLSMLVMTGSWFIRSNFPCLLEDEKQEG